MGGCRCCTSKEEDTTIFGFEGTKLDVMNESVDTINERDFRANAKTGDILLYTTYGFGAKITRGATSSKYDHVAMVVKSLNAHDPNADDKVFIFESVNGYGVRLTDWDYVRQDIGNQNNGKIFKNIVYRSVDFNRE